MERRVRGNSHARCGAGEKVEMASKPYLLLFFLDHMDEFRGPSLLFSASRLLSSLAKLFEDQQQKQTAQADHIDRKRMRELRQKMQAQGHARDEQIQSY